jgi:GNAT superfamily N-acetyltransferase
MFSTLRVKLSRHIRLVLDGQWALLAGRFLGLILPERFFLIEKETVYSAQKPVESASGATVRRASVDELPVILAALDESIDSGLAVWFSDYFSQGNYCYLAEIEGQIAGLAWQIPQLYTVGLHGGRFDSSLEIELDERTSFVANVYVLSQFRKRGVYRQILSKIWADLLSAGDDKLLYVTIASYNERSQQAHIRLGFEPVGHLLQLRFWRWACLFLRDYRRHKKARFPMSPNGPVRVGIDFWEPSESPDSELPDSEEA